MHIEIGDIRIKEDTNIRKPVLDAKDGQITIRVPKCYLITLFVMTNEQFEFAKKLYGDSVYAIDNLGKYLLVFSTIDTKDSLSVVKEIRITTDCLEY